MHVQSVEAGQWWAMPRGAQMQDWVGNYQRSLQARHRTLIVDIVKDLAPATLLELGSHCGPNLVRLTQAMPTLKTLGVDISEDAVTAGKAWVASLGLTGRIELHAGRVPDVTSDVPTGSVDVVLSCYTLAYVAPADLDGVLYEMGRIAKHAVVLAEPMTDEGPASHRHTRNGYHEWAHNYVEASRWIGSLRGAMTRIVPLSPPVDALNGVFVATRPRSLP